MIEIETVDESSGAAPLLAAKKQNDTVIVEL
jgi:hypothetical protein